MLKQLGIAVIVSSCAMPALGQQKSALCLAAEIAIEDALKEIAYAKISGLLDNSAHRENNRLLMQVVGWMEVNSNITQMQTLKCPALGFSISPRAYDRGAAECYITSSLS